MIALLIDAGHSRVKWALAEGNVWLKQGYLENDQVEVLHKSLSGLPPPHRIVASNVAGMHMMQRLNESCAAWPCAIEFISAKSEQCGVRNTYEHPEQLGSDRWAALIAAHHLHRMTCLVVDCGTATTIDSLSADGEFFGGLILPGINMMQHSLSTGSTQLANSMGNWHEFPRNTADAIFSGAIQSTVGAVRMQLEMLAALGEVRCLLSGGAADYVHPHLKLPVMRDNDLVLRGLQIIGQL